MKNTLFVLAVLALLIYPVIIYFGLQYIEPGFLAIFFAFIFGFRHIILTKKRSINNSENNNLANNNPAKNKPNRVMIPHMHVVLITVLSLLAYSTLANSALALKFYPVVVSLSFLAIFAYSLIKPPSVVEIIARLHETLDEHGIKYTRKVTKVWCVFFIINALIATWTIFQDDEQIWLLYNGLISYILMGVLMAVEFVVRFFVKRAVKKSAINNVKVMLDD